MKQLFIKLMELLYSYISPLKQMMNMGAVMLNNGEPYETYSDAANVAATVNYAGNVLIDTMFFWCTDDSQGKLSTGKIDQSIYFGDGSYKCIQILSFKNNVYKRTIGLSDFVSSTKCFTTVTSVGPWALQS